MKTTKILISLIVIITAAAAPKTSYTGYSGAPGSKGSCASSCHGSGTGALTATGFPSSYVPGQTYTLKVQYSSGSSISGFNASARLGVTTTAAGTFTAGTGSSVYTVSGVESGVRASSSGLTSSTFSWKAPAAGSGAVTLYLAGLQGSSGGPNTKITLTAQEQPTSVPAAGAGAALSFSLRQNYPNPFNPATVIRYRITAASMVVLKVFDVRGKEIAALVNEMKSPGEYSAAFDGGGLSGGVYFYRLQAGEAVETKKMALLK